MNKSLSLIFVLLMVLPSFGQKVFKDYSDRKPGKSAIKGDFQKISGKSSSSPSGRPGFSLSFDRDMKVRLVKDPETGAVIFMENLSPDNSGPNSRKSVQAAQLDFLNQMKGRIGLRLPEKELRSLSVQTDENGNRHELFQQYYKDVPVYGGETVIHTTNAYIKALNGRLFPTPENLEVKPALDPIEAVKRGLENLSSHSRLTSARSSLLFERAGNSADLVIYHRGKEPVLAYEMVLRPNDLERWVVFMDAKSGEVIDKYNHTCTLDGVFQTQARDLNGQSQQFIIIQSGSLYYMIDPSKEMFNSAKSSLPDNPQGTIWTIDANNSKVSGELNLSHVTSSNGTAWNSTAVSAHKNAAICYDYFRTKHSRNSLNGNGGNIISVINIADEDGLGMDNAYWNGEFMGYGNGRDGFKPLAGALDVAGHEMTHGVIESTARLEYRNQSGALNESFADIFAALIDRDDWLLGEDIVKGNAFPSGALRSLENPNQGGKNDPGYQPKNMSQYVYLRDIPSEDNGGVHVNSGIPNHAFYLFATSQGMNRDKAERIYYHTLTKYLTRTSKFVDLRLAVIQASKDLYGDGAEAAAAAAAFDAVGIVTSGSSGQTGGQQPEKEIEVNPGNPMVVVFEPSSGNLYRGGVNGGNFDIVSEGLGCQRKPSITDDGSLMFFVGEDGNIYYVDLTKAKAAPQAFTDDGEWGNVAISKDGRLIAALSNSQEPFIYVYNLETQKQASFELYNPTYTEGVSTGEVQFADSFEWDYSGEFLIYDALNRANGVFGELEYWDVGVIRVWDVATKNFANGTIQKLFTDLAEGENIGNPAISKTNPDIIAFDFANLDEEEYAIIGANLHSGDLDLIVENTTIGFPDYSVDDKFLAYTGTQQGVGEVVKVIALNPDKISGATATGQRYFEGGEDTYAVFYAVGKRDLPEKKTQEIEITAPSPQNPGASVVLSGRASSGLQVQYAVIQGDATLSGNQVRLGNTPGLVVIEAFQVGNSEFISVSREISFCINPPTPSIAQIGDNLQASGFSGYQWFVNGNAIGGFTANGILRPDRNGVYSVKSATSDGCFSGFSNQVAIQRVLALNPAEDGVLVFPNPGQEYLRIRVQEQQKLLEVSVSDMNGRHLVTQKDSSIDIRNFPAGTYILKVKTSGSETITRFIKN